MLNIIWIFIADWVKQWQAISPPEASKSKQKRSLPGRLTFSLEGHSWHSTLAPESKS